jgi:hypothetical protein
VLRKLFGAVGADNYVNFYVLLKHLGGVEFLQGFEETGT